MNIAQLQESKYIRRIEKLLFSTDATVPVVKHHGIPQWLDTDIYKGELAVDVERGLVWTRDTAGVFIVGGRNIGFSTTKLTGVTIDDTHPLIINHGKVGRLIQVYCKHSDGSQWVLGRDDDFTTGTTTLTSAVSFTGDVYYNA